MRYLTFFLGFLILSMLLSCSDNIKTEADMVALNKLHEKIENAWNSSDFEGYMDLIEDKAIWMPPNHPKIIGKEAIIEWYDHWEEITFEIEISNTDIQLCGDCAFSCNTWKGLQIPKDGSEPIKFDNDNFAVLKKQSNGSWKITHAIWNSNEPIVTEK
jgi:uncharacterized protein (TIGR02246 family)